MHRQDTSLFEPLSRNLYSYAENNPVNFDDPSGHGILSKVKSMLGGSKKINAKVSVRPRTTNKKSGGSSGTSKNSGWGAVAKASVPTEASVMFQFIKYEDKREVFGFKVHIFSTFDKIKKYDESDNEKSAEKLYTIEVGGTKRTINLYAVASTKF